MVDAYMRMCDVRRRKESLLETMATVFPFYATQITNNAYYCEVKEELKYIGK